MHTHTYMHIHTHTYMYSHTHTYTQIHTWWLQHHHSWLPSQASCSASNSPSCVLRWLWRPAADFQGRWQTWHTKVKVLTGLIRMRNRVFVLNHMPFQSRCRPADLQTLPHITLTVLSGRCGTLDGLSMWDFIWFTYPAFERTRLHVSRIQFALSHGKFSMFPFLHTYIHTYRQTRTYINTYIHTHIHIHTYIQTYTRWHMYTYIHIHTHIYLHTYTHWHIYIYTHIADNLLCAGR